MSRKKKPKIAVPDEILAEGSGPVDALTDVEADIEADIQALGAAASEALSEDPADAPAEPHAEAPPRVLEAPEDLVETTAAMDDDAAESLEAAPAETLEEITDEEAAELGAALPTSAASMDAMQLKYLVESLVFASDKPITILRLRQLTRVSDTRRLEQALVELAEDYKDRGIVLQQISGGYQFRTRTQFSAWVQQLIAGRPVRLSRAQLETLAIVAYRQPITRPEIDEIRGVDSSATLKLLLDRTLIRILGKKEEVGRPLLYGTTKEFLDFFSLGDLRELPTLREYSELTDESRRVMTDELGIDPDAPASLDSTADETIAAEPAPMSIDDIVASYNTSMEVASEDAASKDIAGDESSTTGVFVTHAHVAIGSAEDDDEDKDAESHDSESTLDALAARRMRVDTADVSDASKADALDASVVTDMTGEDRAQAGEPDSTSD